MKEQKICDEEEKTVRPTAEQETSRASPQGCHNGTHGIASSPAPGEETSTPLPPDSFCAARVNCQSQFSVLALCQMQGDSKFL